MYTFMLYCILNNYNMMCKKKGKEDVGKWSQAKKVSNSGTSLVWGHPQYILQGHLFNQEIDIVS